MERSSRREAFRAGRLLRRAGAALVTLLAALFSPPHAAAAVPLTAREPAASGIIARVRPGQDLSSVHRRLGTRGRKLFRRRRDGNTPDLELVETTPGNRDAVLAALRQSGLVDYAEPDYVLSTLATPNDFRYTDGSLWHLHNTGIYGGTVGADIDAPSAWDLRTSAASVVVAVVDTGARLTHEDLRGNLWWNPGELGYDGSGRPKATNGVDDDGDGYIDDVHGINSLTHTGDPTDDYGHGTHVAAIIGATGNNSVGVVGVAWRTQLMPLKALDSTGQGPISSVIECLDYARTHGARIVNASWGSYTFTSQALRDAITALRNDGILFVAACGNNGTDNETQPLYPASYEFDNIIAVAATTRTDNRASFSNWGRTTVDLAAPGSPIFSAWNGSDSDYRYMDGTSQAAPQVAGAAALIWGYHPAFTYRQVIQFILDNTDPLADFANKSVTGGRLNVAQALAAAVQAAPIPPDETPPKVTMSRPRLASVIKGSVAVSATATDDVGVAGVQFTLDGVNLGPEDTTAPYSYTWDTRTVPNGLHVVGARARDAAGNQTTALAGTVTVSN